MKKFSNITPKKAKRKIYYLRSMSTPNFVGGATRATWEAFWRAIRALKLVSGKHPMHWPY